MKLIKNILMASAVTGVLVSSTFANADLVAKGEKIFNTKNLGNCLACHAVNGKNIDGPGSMGPKLQYLSAWPEQALYDKIYDPYTTNPISQMPAFGKNGWLSDSEIKALVAYLKTIN
ncbi:sulfur oxidation c-type cytochrome SoxX [Arcobacter sp.]|uniref:sulfur oxidation c-type cytochrome SoxX n=1 Tax=Arcobacter sp. TaxID=1872629 RepID=UPI003D12CDA3